MVSIPTFKGVHRETAHAGEIPYEQGYLEFSESFDGEYFHFKLFDGTLDETKRISLTPYEIEAIAMVGYLTESVEVDRLVEDCERINENMRKRDRALREIREKYEEDTRTLDISDTDYDAAHSWLDRVLAGGDGVPEYYPIEGWGIQRLDNGGFEVTSYKV